MKNIFFYLFTCFFPLNIIAQTDENPKMTDTVSNSYKSQYQREAPQIRYSYEEGKQIHNYSGNWDFDGDGKADSLLFVGNGAAHLYYHLRIILSSDSKARDFTYLSIDMPILQPIDSLIRRNNESMYFTKFVVYDFNKDGKVDIYINIHSYGAVVPKELRKTGITSNQVVISYEKKRLVISEYSFK